MRPTLFLCACLSGCSAKIVADVTGPQPDAATGDALDAADPPPRPTFRNPLNGGPDPFLVYDSGSAQYLLATTQGDRIALWRAPSLGQLAVRLPTTIWSDSNTSRNRNIWAPSMHHFDGRWYVYYTADDGVDEHHRLYVIESDADDPLGPYHFKAKLEPPGATGLFAIDPIVLEQGGHRYLLWSGAGSEGHNLLYIAPLSSPWTVAGVRTYLLASGGCNEVREAPSIVQHAGTTFLVYSACDTGKPDYQLWALSIPMTADPMVAANWTQIAHPLFTRSDADGVWGPGSCSFFKSPDGTEDWLAYHAKNTSQYTYDLRTTRAQRIDWASGEPDLGTPVRIDAELELPAGDPGAHSFALDDGDANSVTYSVGWTEYATCGVQCFEGDDHGSTQIGATATIEFTGTQIALLSVRDKGNGIATFAIDGNPGAYADLYAPIRQGEQQIYVSPVLPLGPHTLRVQVTGTKQTSSAGHAISLDRIEIYAD
ncbi:MAG TPA: glycoside hydrolase family 43 protein [Kofleriaceae bacterium]|nr:glycoside hydrolase family 43 protein [Kofleriaceae bacterium]